MRGKRHWLVGLSLVGLCGMLGAAKAEARELSGRVRCPNDNPVAEATVTFYAVGMDRETMRYVITELGDTRTNGLGEYTFPVAEETSPESQVICLVESEGFSCGWANYYSPTDTPTVRLTMSSVMSGVVHDADGQPVAGAEVRPFFLHVPGEMPNMMLGIEPIEAFVAMTDEDGRFEFVGLPETATAEFMVKKDGMGRLMTLDSLQGIESGFTFKAGQTDIELTLPAGCVLTGRVEDQDGQPVEGIRVTATDSRLPISLWSQSAVSDAAGTFHLAELAPGGYRLTAQSDDWVADPVAVEVRGDTEATVVLNRGSVLEATVLDGGTGEPIEGAGVWVRLENMPQVETLTTDADGIGRKKLLPGRYSVSARKEGYQFDQTGETVDVTNGQTATVTLRLEEYAKLTGRVVDEQGRAVEGAEVRMLREHTHQATSDADGHFELAWDPSQLSSTNDIERELIVLHKARNLAVVEPVGEGSGPVTVTLRDAVRARGRIVGADGKPVADCKTRIFFRGERYGTYFGLESRTDEEGGYELVCLPADQRYSVEISNIKGYGTASQEFVTGHGEPAAVDEIVLEVANLRVTGQVIDADGEPMADVQVYSYGEGQPQARSTTDAEGRFVLENVCAGRLSVSANYRDGGTYLNGYVQTEGGAEDVQLVIGARDGGQFVPRKAPTLTGKGLGEVLASCGVTLPAEPNAAALFVWDMNQRPSRHFVKAFTGRATALQERGVTAVLLQAGPTERATLDGWLTENGIDCPCGMIEGDADEATFKLGVRGLPWLILTDGEGKVVAEGISVDELEAVLNAMQ